jgi:lipoprotein-anchoring transpeptidase ErfK/SrfK
VQVLLDRAGISPGVIDGRRGGMSESALRAFELREGLVVDGILDPGVWDRLGGPTAGPVLADYTVTAEDAEDLSPDIPEDYAEKAELSALGYQRVSERLAERFHMDEDFLVALNPEAGFDPGETVTVAAVGARLEAEVARIEVRKGTGRLAAFDLLGRMIANYPVTVGSEDTPSPAGRVEVVAVAFEPTYHYDPEANFQQGDNDEPLTLPAGPNGPVGSIWIDLSPPTTAFTARRSPTALQAQSHGCVRLTNWDAEELAHMVREGTVVEFVE